MAKKIKAVIKLYCPAGQANPAPPVGPALGQHGLNIMEFCKQFNAKSKGQEGLILPVIITAYEDRSFSFIVKSPPSAILLKRYCGIAKASSVPHKEKVGAVTKAQVKEIVKTKIKDLNTDDMEQAMKIVEGTARSMGIEVVEKESDVKKVLEEIAEQQKESQAVAGGEPPGTTESKKIEPAKDASKETGGNVQKS